MIIWLLFLLQISDSHKYLIISPLFGHSHTHFMGKIADTLTEAGHDVTVLMPVLDPDLVNKTGLRLTKKLIKVHTDPRTEALMESKANVISNLWTMQPSPFSMIQMATNMSNSFTWQCEKIFNDDALMGQLMTENFDVGIAEPFDICGFGIFEVIHLPATIIASSCVHVEPVSSAIGEPSAASYVPGLMSTKGDVMNVFEKLRNLLEIKIESFFFENVYSNEIASFRAKFGPNFKSYRELLAQASYVFTNSNPYLDYPHPTIHKSIGIGGIAVDIGNANANQLSQEWDTILNQRKINVLVSFGSVAKSVYMPDNYKQSLLSVFSSLPFITFIWKYEDEGASIVNHVPNVHLSTWVPQNSLLADPRLSLFITHGGLGSTTELAHMGKPAVMVPLFADQMRNANMLARHGGAIVLTKYDLGHPEKIRTAIEMAIKEPNYAASAHRLSEMLLNQPISAKQLLIKHAEFAARFGRLPNLDPYGRHLSALEYYLIDVFIFIVFIVVLVMGFATTVIYRCCFFKKTKDKRE